MTDATPFVPQSQYDKAELVACGMGDLFGAGNAQLPVENMLMVDRISHISSEGGATGKGELIAELDIHPDLWFFDCHFETDPVMPGCLGLDATWQLLGFFLGWLGNPGRGRALGVGQVKFSGQILPTAKKVTYRISVKRVIARKLTLGIADAVVSGKKALPMDVMLLMSLSRSTPRKMEFDGRYVAYADCTSARRS